MSDKPKIPADIQCLIDAAKAENHLVFSVKVAGTTCYYRSLSRSEFRQIQDKLSADAELIKEDADKKKEGLKDDDPKLLQINKDLEKKANEIKEKTEEVILSKALLYPKLSSSTPAGFYTTLSDRVMEASGFGADAEPEML
jgi:hypothetical protein